VSWQNSLKGGVLCALLWWAWFSGRARARETVLSSVAAAFLGVVIARALAASLPFRPRPLAAGLHLTFPTGVHAPDFVPWSAFPSDHATLFVALATGLWFVSRPVGAAALAWTGALILFPRLYGGIHWPSDLAAGGVLGAGLAIGFNRSELGERLARPLLAFEERHRQFFYAIFFAVCFEIGELFTGVINSARALFRVLS
jgi:undecaprenyl-diphosphatase